MPDREAVNPFDADYFLHGKEKGLSLYENYRYLPHLTIPMVRAMIGHLEISGDDTILDFGCARGYVVKAFLHCGYEAYGLDCSEWAIENADPAVKGRLFHGDKIEYMGSTIQWIIAKDVLEHVADLQPTIDNLMEHARIGVFAVVPLGIEDGSSYVVPAYEEDVTHIHRLTLTTWAGLFMRPGWAVTAQYRAVGVKDNYAQYERGNGFIVCKRI